METIKKFENKTADKAKETFFSAGDMLELTVAIEDKDKVSYKMITFVIYTDSLYKLVNIENGVILQLFSLDTVNTIKLGQNRSIEYVLGHSTQRDFTEAVRLTYSCMGKDHKFIKSINVTYTTE